MINSSILYQQKETFFLIASVLVFLILIFLFNSCCSRIDDSEELKFDPSLKQKILVSEQNTPDEIISVFIKTSDEFNDEMKTQIEKTGLSIESIIGQIITAKGTSKQIRETARLPFILKLELSQTREPN